MDGNDKFVGRILDNRYEILELIGTGGMALVYKARCHRLNRMVAVKILKEDLAGDEEFQRRFYTESQAVAMLSHPNIVSVYDVSRSGSTEYIVMELIEGITLKQYINRKGLLNWKEALHFATQITKALSHAHSRGIIHRDIKPHNIMILKDGSVKVADFGIARLLTVANTLTQEALGSVHYISPEQAKGGQVDARSDIYSVGVVMYEMLTSRLPFVGESPVSVAIQHISAIPLMPRDINPDIPVGLEDITMHAMEPDLNMRFTTAEEMLGDLEEFRKNPSIVFNYIMSGPGDKQPVESEVFSETRIIPKGASVRPEGAMIKAERPKPPAKRRTRVKPDLSSDEYRLAKTRASSTSTLIGVFSIIVFLVVIVVFMWTFFLRDIFSPQDREQITIPSFANRRYEDIIRNDEYTDIYSFTKREEYNSDFAPGVIISQSPVADRPVSAPLPGRKITIDLVVSLGDAPPTLMPELIGMHYGTAINILVNRNLELQIEDYEVASNEPPGLVIETIPGAGDNLSRGNRVIIRYSGGPNIPMLIVPDIVLPTTRAAVMSAFRSLDLELVIEEYIDTAHDPGTVTYIQNAGEEVPAGSRIVVHTTILPPVEETPEPPETPDVQETPEPPDSTYPPESPEPPYTTEPPEVTYPSPETPPEPLPTDGGGASPNAF